MTDKTKLIVVCNPGNPTGAKLPASKVKELVQFAQDYNLFMISDEIYSSIVFDAPHACAGSFEPQFFSEATREDSRLAVVSGVSKAYAMTGFRVGWTRCAPSLVTQMTKLQVLSSHLSAALIYRPYILSKPLY